MMVVKCAYHKQLTTDINKVKGGGWWSLDRENPYTLYYFKFQYKDISGEIIELN